MDEQIKLSDIPTASAVPDGTVVTGITPNGDGTFSNYNFSQEQIALIAALYGKKKIVSGIDGPTLTDVFFASEISFFIAGNQIYVADADFTQNTTANTITWTGTDFYTGQIILVIR